MRELASGGSCREVVSGDGNPTVAARPFNGSAAHMLGSLSGEVLYANARQVTVAKGPAAASTHAEAWSRP